MFTLPDCTVYNADSIVALIKKGRSDFLVEIRAEFLSFWTADCKRQKGCSNLIYISLWRGIMGDVVFLKIDMRLILS